MRVLIGREFLLGPFLIIGGTDDFGLEVDVETESGVGAEIGDGVVVLVHFQVVSGLLFYIELRCCHS